MSCSASPPCDLHEVPLEDIDIAFEAWAGPAIGRKALAYPLSKRIRIDPAFWETLRETDARMGMLAHERGHIEGARCESCADRRAGEILKREGTINPGSAMRADIEKLEHRDGVAAALDLKAGFGLDRPSSPPPDAGPPAPVEVTVMPTNVDRPGGLPSSQYKVVPAGSSSGAGLLLLAAAAYLLLK